MKVAFGLVLSLFSLCSFAGKDSCAFNLRFRAGVSTLAAMTPVLAIYDPYLGNEAFYLLNDADSLKSAHILTHKECYQYQSVLRAGQKLANFFAKLKETYFYSRLTFEEVRDAMEDLYASGTANGFCGKISYKMGNNASLENTLFKDGKLDYYISYKKTFEEARKAKLDSFYIETALIGLDP